MFDRDLESARRHFTAAEELVHQTFGGPGGRSWLARVGTVLALAERDVDLGRHWAERDGDPFSGPLSRARVLVATSHRAEALDLLEQAVPRCDRHRVVLGLLRSRAVDNHDSAVKELTLAVELAAEAGLLQTVADEGEDVMKMVELAAWRVPQAWLDRLRRIVVPGASLATVSKGMVEDLTERERDVLRLLPSRLTLREIANELFVSQNTLKFHLRVIYRKLGVNSRAEAVQAARSLSPPPHHSSKTLAR